MMMTIDEKDYYCDGCKISFKTIKERVEHQKSCETRKDRLFTCKLCNKELKLDDAEFDKLNAKGQVTTECPFCKNSYVFIND
jgi:redox-regulated HSP33 family molecular chaperone